MHTPTTICIYTDICIHMSIICIYAYVYLCIKQILRVLVVYGIWPKFMVHLILKASFEPCYLRSIFGPLSSSGGGVGVEIFGPECSRVVL